MEIHLSAVTHLSIHQHTNYVRTQAHLCTVVHIVQILTPGNRPGFRMTAPKRFTEEASCESGMVQIVVMALSAVEGLAKALEKETPWQGPAHNSR